VDLRQRIDSSPMSPFQWVIVALCVLLNCLDGFDVMAMAFTAAPVADEFGLSGSELGVLLSAGLVGMAGGSLLLAPFADRIGRRPMILLCLALASGGMLLGALSTSALMLGATRVLTGLGVGGILACTNVIASEYSSIRRRGLAIGIYTAGYGIGASLGGLAAASLQEELGWRSIFVFGGVATAASLVLLAVLLPESVDFLLARRPSDVLERINRVAVRIRQPRLTAEDLAALPAAGQQGKAHPGLLLSGRLRRPTLLVWVAFFTTMYGFYFVNSWTPKLLVDSGLTTQQGVTGGLALALGGTIGSVLYGVVSTRRDHRVVLIGFTVLAAVAMVLFISSTSVLALALVVGVVVGALINGCIAGLYTITPALYETRLRSTGMGWGIGVGRIGAILAPLATGRLIDAAWSPVQLYVVAAAVVTVSALALTLLGRPGRPDRAQRSVRARSASSSA
jgi:benzoate transport